MIISETGTVTRALPNGMALEIKVRRRDGSALILEIAPERGDLIRTARQARMDETEVLVRYSSDGRVIGFDEVRDRIAA